MSQIEQTDPLFDELATEFTKRLREVKITSSYVLREDLNRTVKQASFQREEQTITVSYEPSSEHSANIQIVDINVEP